MIVILLYFILSAAIALATVFVRKSESVSPFVLSFFAVQVAFCAVVVFGDMPLGAFGSLFVFDALSVTLFVAMLFVAMLTFAFSRDYLYTDDRQQRRIYYALLMGLVTALSGVYFSNNIALTWIFLEATTVCAAGVIYHRRTDEALEATWKYLFVCSTGVAMAYLGVLLLSGVSSSGDLSYDTIRGLVVGSNPLYLKIAFMLILTGYSCKMEVFPLYTIGVDANFATPAPASALLSTGLVNAGFVAIYRVYNLLSGTEIFEWVKSVLIITGVVSLLIAALFMRRTNNYKRLLSYSTVENMGLVLIGLGVGGVGVWAAVFHLLCHTFIKSSMFWQIAVARKCYQSYSINRIGAYMKLNAVGAVGLMACLLTILAFPPSPMFLSEVMILKSLILSGRWWVVVLMIPLLCIIIHTLCLRIFDMCFGRSQDRVSVENVDRRMSYLAALPLVVAIVVGVWQSDFVVGLIDKIIVL